MGEGKFPAMIICHGFNANSAPERGLAKMYAEAGVVTYIFDFIGGGKNRMFVSGESQGGFMATYFAGTRPDDVKGLVAFYPAYVLQNDAFRLISFLVDIPETVDFLGATVSRKYPILKKQLRHLRMPNL